MPAKVWRLGREQTRSEVQFATAPQLLVKNISFSAARKLIQEVAGGKTLTTDPCLFKLYREKARCCGINATYIMKVKGLIYIVGRLMKTEGDRSEHSK